MLSWKEHLEENWKGSLSIKENRIVVKNIWSQAVVVPSRMFPLKDKDDYKIFSHYNTENFDMSSDLGKRVAKVFDGVKGKIGECYSNCKLLIQGFEEEGISAEVYAGWFFIKDELPIYHTFIVIDENKVLDFSVYLTEADLDKIKSELVEFTKDEMRRLMVKRYEDKLLLSNHEKFGFGKVDTCYFYIGCKSEIEEAKQLHKELLKIYPNHIAYIKTGNSKYTKTQDMIKSLGNY